MLRAQAGARRVSRLGQDSSGPLPPMRKDLHVSTNDFSTLYALQPAGMHIGIAASFCAALFGGDGGEMPTAYPILLLCAADHTVSTSRCRFSHFSAGRHREWSGGGNLLTRIRTDPSKRRNPGGEDPEPEEFSASKDFIKDIFVSKALNGGIDRASDEPKIRPEPPNRVKETPKWSSHTASLSPSRWVH